MFHNSVVIISCSGLNDEEVIKNITDSESLPEAVKINDEIQSYKLYIETKYYVATINLVSLKKKDLVGEEFANSVEAVILLFNGEQLHSFEEAQSWLPFIEKFSPQVQMLICSKCYDDNEKKELTRPTVLDWCLKNQFELVELLPTEEPDTDVEDDFQETKGYKRVIQALHAHTWNDMTMKDPPVYCPSEEVLSSLREDRNKRQNGIVGHSNEVIDRLLDEPVSDSATAAEAKENEADKSKEEKIDNLFKEDKWLFDAVGQDDPSGESFESMFSKILNMKDKAATLVGDERKLYAEKVAVEFWKAIGGDEEEIADLSSDEN